MLTPSAVGNVSITVASVVPLGQLSVNTVRRRKSAKRCTLASDVSVQTPERTAELTEQNN